MPEGVDVAVGGGLVAVGGTVAVAALKLVEALLAKRRSPEQKLGEAAGAASELIKLALEASGTSVQQVLEQQEELRTRLHGLEQSHSACEARCEALNGDLRQANQRIDSLLRQLKDPAATGPGGVLAGAVFEMAGGEVVVHPAPPRLNEGGA